MSILRIPLERCPDAEAQRKLAASLSLLADSLDVLRRTTADLQRDCAALEAEAAQAEELERAYAATAAAAEQQLHEGVAQLLGAEAPEEEAAAEAAVAAPGPSEAPSTTSPMEVEMASAEEGRPESVAADSD